MKILWVENNSLFVRIVLKTFLAAHEVEVAPSLCQAKHALAAGTYDVILLDYDLEDGKGADLVGYIKQLLQEPLLIAASSHTDGNDKLTQAGADAVCSKKHFAQIENIISQARRNASQQSST